MDNIQMIFGEVIKKIRKDKNLSQEKLAFQSGLDRTYISLLERGQRNPSLKTIFALSKALETSPSELIQILEKRIV